MPPSVCLCAKDGVRCVSAGWTREGTNTPWAAWTPCVVWSTWQGVCNSMHVHQRLPVSMPLFSINYSKAKTTHHLPSDM